MADLPVPEWIKSAVSANKAALRAADACRTRTRLLNGELETVCVQALCPNRGKCFSEGEATFLILGDTCTRRCGFCAVKRGRPPAPDADEPARIASVSASWKLRHIMFTSPTRDDLADGGAGHFALVTREIRKALPSAGIEPLVPDFAGSFSALETVLGAGPDVLAHNLETVPRLYAIVRNGAGYKRSLGLLRHSKSVKPEILTKSGLMLGLGETPDEVERVLEDLLKADCDLLTLGQYLAPSRSHLPVKRYLHPDEFAAWEMKARQMGFNAVMSGPLVRSSYRAGRLYKEAKAAVKRGTRL